MPAKKRLAVLISGRGSNMEALLDATREEGYPAELVLVISDNPEAAGLQTALNSDINTYAFTRSDYGSRDEHEAAISEVIDNHTVDLVCLAGYMRILSPELSTRYSGRLINIHPSLLPKFKGLDTHTRAIEAGESEHGCTVHYVNEEMDGGEIIAQSAIAVLPGDTPETLAARVLVEEHKLYPRIVKELCN
ncbi:MAG: phosphoribosylglycinamide formyltransferase [Rhizobiaceae bacterium]